MKKREAIIILSVLLMIICPIFVSAANDTIESEDNGINVNDALKKGYECLDKITNKPTNSISLQEAIFATIALGNKKNLTNKIEAEKSTSTDCWPKSGCTIKDTAQVAMAYERNGKGNENILKWLMARNGTSTDLVWYLEIDIANHGRADCTLKYDGTQKQISILEDMKIYGSPGSCFSISPLGYWLTFRENCYEKEVQITCNQDFVTTKLYQRKSGGTIYVMPQTHSAVGLGSTSEKVSVKCFKLNNKCDYEGSLWAASVLQKEGKDIGMYLPYLVALTEDNKKYFPSSFLYGLTGADDQLNEIIQSQKQGRYWKMVNTPYNEFYDTSLAMMVLGKNTASEADNVRNYLLSIQSSEGCWNNNNIRDTAFILFAGWPNNNYARSEDGGGSSTALCTAVSTQSCEAGTECTAAGGTILGNFGGCGLKSCCSIAVPKLSCLEKNGKICAANEECSASYVSSEDSEYCCLETCTVRENLEFSCEVEMQGNCKDECESGEEETDGTCQTGVCCQIIEKPSYGWLIFLLIILIILIILAIIYRNKLIFYYHKYKGNAKVSPIVKPSVPPSSLDKGQQFRTTLSPRYMPAQQRQTIQRPVQRAVNPKDKEFEETLKKLKDMSK